MHSIQGSNLFYEKLKVVNIGNTYQVREEPLSSLKTSLYPSLSLYLYATPKLQHTEGHPNIKHGNEWVFFFIVEEGQQNVRRWDLKIFNYIENWNHGYADLVFFAWDNTSEYPVRWGCKVNKCTDKKGLFVLFHVIHFSVARWTIINFLLLKKWA